MDVWGRRVLLNCGSRGTQEAQSLVVGDKLGAA